MEEKEIRWSCLKLKGNEDLICPYCERAQHIGSEDYVADGDEKIIECGYCEKEFIYDCNFSITYNSYGLGEIPNEERKNQF